MGAGSNSPTATFAPSGVTVSRLGFGCAGLYQLPTRRQRQRLLSAAFDAGLTHFDVARLYGLGAAEAELGRFAKTKRSEITIATKFGLAPSRAAEAVGRVQGPLRAALRAAEPLRREVKKRDEAVIAPRRYDAAAACASLDRSLSELGTDYVDFLFLHEPRPFDRIFVDEIRDFLQGARSAGKIRAWGTSQDHYPELTTIDGLGSSAVLQVRDSILEPVTTDRPHLSFGVLGGVLAAIDKILLDRGARERWDREIQVDPQDRGELGWFVLAEALDRNRGGAVLYSTTLESRLASAAATLREDRFSTEQIEAFRGLIADTGRDRQETASESIFTGDTVVVGAGPLGIVTALELADAGQRVVLLESGAEAQTLAESASQDPFHVPKDLAVKRGVGGTSALWGGRCVPFDPVDFEERAIAPEIRWPVSYGEIEKYFQKACDWCVCGEATFNASLVDELSGRSMVPGLADGDVRTTDLERWSLPTRFADVYGERLREHPNIELVEGWTCTEVVTQSEGTSVEHLDLRRLDGSKARAKADAYVVATGGLEATRLLLASNRHHDAGLGNAGGHLGRWYMAHVEGRIAEAHLSTDPDLTIYAHERDRDGVYVRRRFTFSPELQARKKLANGASWFVNPPMADDRHGSGILSGVYLTLISPAGKFLLAEGIRRAGTKALRPTTVRAHVANILRDLGPAVRFAFSFSYQRFLRPGRKAPGFFVKSAANVYPLQYHGEHLPHWDSRVTLSEERDQLGMPRLDIAMRYSDDDVASVRRAMEEIDAHLRAAGVGHLEYLYDDLDQAVRDYLVESAGYHQTGTTRMSDRSEDGVVDRNLRVHGVSNLWIASTSVFPTSSQANPTFMGVAFAVRLAEAIAARLAAGAAPDTKRFA